MTISRTRLAVLASGGGSNLQAIHDHLERRGDRATAELALVVSDRQQSGALERARGWGVPAVHLDKASLDSLAGLLAEHRIEIIALAGFLRLVPPTVTRAFAGRILNIHPALLPDFGGPGMYGQRVHEAVIQSGASTSGATVHFVSEHYDEGAIVAQWKVPVLADDTAATLAQRVLGVEHQLFPLCVSALAEGALRLTADGQVEQTKDLDFDRFPSGSGQHSFGG